MRFTLLLLTQAQTTSNVSGGYLGRIDEDLNEEGVRQASRLADRLSSWPIGKVCTSPLKRARSTAEAVAHPHILPLATVAEFTKIDISRWQDMLGSQIAAAYADLWKSRRSNPANWRLRVLNERAICATKRKTVTHLNI